VRIGSTVNKPLKPGQKAPFSAQVELVGPRGARLGAERTVVKGSTLPPTPKPGQGYVVVDKTNNGAGKRR